MPNTPPQLIAGGTIYTCRFVKVSTAADDTCLQGSANCETIGISQSGSNKAPLSDVVSTNYAAESGETLEIYGDGDVCLLEAGAVITRGALLASDGNGCGTTATAGQNVGAIALQSASASGVKIRVQVRHQIKAS